MIARTKNILGICLSFLCLFILFLLPGFSDEKPQVIPLESAQNTQLRKALDAEIDVLSGRLFEMNDWMYHHPEPGFLEFKAAALLIEELKKNGFTVEEGVPGFTHGL